MKNIQDKHWWFVVKKNIILDIIRRYCKIDNNCKILDIGCGSGLMLDSLEKIGQVCGIDMSDEAIKFSQEISQSEIKKGSLPDQIPYEKDSFNVIVALDVIEHIDKDIESLKTIYSLLAHKGKAIITVPAYMFLWSYHDIVNEHKRRYTLSELKNKLLDAGFVINKISYFNTLLFPLVYFIRMLNNFSRKNETSDIEMPNRAVNFLLKQIFGIEKYLLKFANLPFGVSILAVIEKK